MAGRGLLVERVRRSAVATCASVDPVELTDGEVLDAVLGLSVVLGRVESCLARATDSFRNRSLHTLDAARSVEGWLAARTQLSHGRAKGLVGAGRLLPSCPHVDAAFAAGSLGSAKVELLLGARDRVEDLFAEHEAELVEQVAVLTVRHAKVFLAHWRAVALATVGADDGEDPSTDDTLNSLHVSSTYLGRFRVDGNLDAITGQRLADTLAAERDARFRSGHWSVDDGLTLSQRNAVILADLLDGQTTAERRHPDADVDVDADGEGDVEGAGVAPRAAATRGGRARPGVTISWMPHTCWVRRPTRSPMSCGGAACSGRTTCSAAGWPSGSCAMPTSPRSSCTSDWTERRRRSAWPTPGATPRPPSAPPWWCETGAASSLDATPHPGGPTPTTPSPTSSVGAPPSTSSSCSVDGTTTPSTKAATPSGAPRTTAGSTSPIPTATSSRRSTGATSSHRHPHPNEGPRPSSGSGTPSRHPGARRIGTELPDRVAGVERGGSL